MAEKETAQVQPEASQTPKAEVQTVEIQQPPQQEEVEQSVPTAETENGSPSASQPASTEASQNAPVTPQSKQPAKDQTEKAAEQPPPKEEMELTERGQSDRAPQKVKTKGKLYFKGVSPAEVEFSLRHMSLMLKSGLSITESLEVIVEQALKATPDLENRHRYPGAPGGMLSGQLFRGAILAALRNLQFQSG